MTEMPEPQQFVGIVHMHRIGQGSRYEHDAIFIETKDARLELRTQGMNPFQPDEFVPFIGRRVAVTGYVVEERLLFVTDLEPIDTVQN